MRSAPRSSSRSSWSQPAPAFPEQAQLYDYIRKAPVRKRTVEKQTGSVDQAMAGAAKIVNRRLRMAVPIACQHGLGRRGRRNEGRRDDGLDRLAEAALRARRRGRAAANAAGEGARDLGDRPRLLRPQRCRRCRARSRLSVASDGASRCASRACAPRASPGIPKAPASVHHAKAGLDASGKIIAYQFESKGFSRLEIDSNESDPGGQPHRPAMGRTAQAAPMRSARRKTPTKSQTGVLAWETIAPPLDRVSPLRTSHMRDPLGPQIHFASESFIDEMALAAKADPVEFRLKHLSGRDAAAVKAAAEKFGWQTRVVRPARRQERRCRDRPRHRLVRRGGHHRRHRRRGRGRSPQRQGARQALRGRA